MSTGNSGCSKNLVISSFGLGKPDQAKKYQDLLYKAYKDKKLPEGMDQYYNFTYFKWQDKNVWGYEWYPEPGDPDAQGGYSKIIYYVYSTNADGTDKEQLYRLHVVRAHNNDNALKLNYVLSKRLENAQNEVSWHLYWIYLQQEDQLHQASGRHQSSFKGKLLSGYTGSSDKKINHLL